MVGNWDAGRKRTKSWRFSFTLLVAASFAPLQLVVVNSEKFPHPGRIVFVIGALYLLALLWYSAFRWLGIRDDAAEASAMVFIALVGFAGPLSASISTQLAGLLVVGCAIAVLLMANRANVRFMASLITGFSVFAVLSLTALWAQDSLKEQGRSEVDVTMSLMPPTLNSHPDIFLILLDGFPGPRALREVYDEDLAFGRLSSVERYSAWASYPLTIASVASLMQMNYPLNEDDIIDSATAEDLARIMSGDNRLAVFLGEHGYTSTHVESGYSRSYCGSTVDICVASPFLDEGTFGILDRTILRSALREEVGSPFTHAALSSMRWLKDNLPALAMNDRKDFVFASVAMPHPPLFVDEACQFKYEYWRSGNSVFAGLSIIEERQQAFVDQAQCVADFESEVFRSVPDEALVVFFSDHGGDSLGQMARSNHLWSRLEMVERLNAHLAVRSPVPCSLESPVFLSELLRNLVWCLASGEAREPPPDRRLYSASRVGDTLNYRLSRITDEDMVDLDHTPRSNGKTGHEW